MISPLRAVLYAERHAAPACILCVRVVENEPLAHQARVVVEHGAVKQPKAPGIDEDLRAVRALEYDVCTLGRLLPAEYVLEPRAARSEERRVGKKYRSRW